MPPPGKPAPAAAPREPAAALAEQPNGHADIHDKAETANEISSGSKAPPGVDEDREEQRQDLVQMQKAGDSKAEERGVLAEQEDKQSEQEEATGNGELKRKVAVNGILTAAEQAEAR